MDKLSHDFAKPLRRKGLRRIGRVTYFAAATGGSFDVTNRVWIAAGMLALAAVAGVGPALSQTSTAPSAASGAMPSEATGFVGQWILQQEGSDDATCPLNMTDRPAATGWVAEPLDFCPASFPVFASWSIEGGGTAVVLYDKAQHEVLRLQPNQDGMLDSSGSGESPTYQLAPYDAGGEQDTD